jgi:phosphoribosylanthranilate isomerase
MRDQENIGKVASLGPDYLGFIFYPESPRFVGDDFIIHVSLPHNITPVAVFVNETTPAILTKAKANGFEFVQLHGNETVQQCLELKDAGLHVVKVFSVDDAFDLTLTHPYKKVVDYFLFDTKGKYYGGNAQTFNWDILNRYDQEIPFFLSGGLTVANVGALDKVLNMNLHALDLNSGVETSPGLKSLEKLEKVLKQVLPREAD